MFNKQYFNRIFRGTVKQNSGEGSEGGKCKIFIPGVYPIEYENTPIALPWAEPAIPLFGGNFSGEGEKTGICGWPAVNSHVWVFFDSDEYLHPIYFAGCSGTVGWSAENNNQWLIKTNNVTIKIDENEDEDRLSLVCNGNVNISIDGNVTQTISGDVTQTISGDVNEVIEKNVTREIKGDINEIIKGNVTRSIEGNLSTEISGSDTYQSSSLQITSDITVIGNITITGDITITGNTVINGMLTNNGIIFSTHTHGGVQSGSAFTLPPV